MAECKTNQNNADVDAFLSTVTPERKRQDCMTLLRLMGELTEEAPRVWRDMLSVAPC